MEHLQAVVVGLGVGSVYALIAFGISLVYATSRTLNFAHGEVLVVGVFLALTAVYFDLPPWQGVIVGIAGAVLLGVALEKVVFKPLKRSPESLAWLLGLLIVGAVITNASARIWGQSAYNSEQLGIGKALGADAFWRWNEIVIPTIYVWLFATGVALMIALDLLIRRTAFGRAVRAVAHSRRTAALMGIDTERTMVIAFGLAAGLGALAGIMFSPLTFVQVQLGSLFTFKGLAAAVIGGLGSARGAFLGGLVLGLVEQEALIYVRAGYRDAIAFGVLILVLVLRPAGIMGSVVEERH
ncbi:MAG: branched-chain amino acid ABC transporter permease [Actinomycetota bacterium]